VSSKEHWKELNNTSVFHLSSHAWSKQHFQPKHTFGYEWPDRTEGMPVARAIKLVTSQFSTLQSKFIDIMETELDDALKLSTQNDGTGNTATLKLVSPAE
jgi:hypothetical protein